MTLDEIKEQAFGHGFAFGKYTEQVILDDEFKKVLDTDQVAMREYMTAYNDGFNTGFADTLRYDNFDNSDIYEPMTDDQ